MALLAGPAGPKVQRVARDFVYFDVIAQFGKSLHVSRPLL